MGVEEEGAACGAGHPVGGEAIETYLGVEAVDGVETVDPINHRELKGQGMIYMGSTVSTVSTFIYILSLRRI
jgi:hypothetical protein